MCLGVPGEVVEIYGPTALVDFWGTKKEVRLDTVDEPVEPGDYILNHVGFAISRIPEEEVEETLAFFDGIMNEETTDLQGEDILDELQEGEHLSQSSSGSSPDSSDGSDSDSDADLQTEAENLLEELDIDV